MNQLAQFLMSQRPGTIGNPAQSSPAQYQVDILKAQRDQELADQMMHQGYVQNSGGLGVLASALSSLVGAKMSQGANESLSSALASKFEDDNKAAVAKREQELADEERKYQRELERDRKKAETEAANRQPSIDQQAWDMIPPELRGKAALGKFGLLDKPTAPRQPTEMESKIKFLQDHGVPPDQINAMLLGASAAGAKPKEQPAEVRNKLALIDNAIANATEYQRRTVGPDGAFADVASMTGDTPQLINSAVQDLLYAKSGASAPAEEVAKAHAMYAPARLGGVIPTEFDKTASAKVGNLLNDLKRMRAEIAGEQQGQAAPAAPAGKPGSPIPAAAPGLTGNPLIDKYLQHP